MGVNRFGQVEESVVGRGGPLGPQTEEKKTVESVIWADGWVETEGGTGGDKKSKEQKGIDVISVAAAPWESINDMKSESDERVGAAAKGRWTRRQIESLYLRRPCVREIIFPQRPSRVSFRPLITAVMENWAQCSRHTPITPRRAHAHADTHARTHTHTERRKPTLTTKQQH